MDYKLPKNKEKIILYLVIVAFFLIAPVIFIIVFIVGLFLWWMQLEGRITWK